jgi:hypothetical protein
MRRVLIFALAFCVNFLSAQTSWNYDITDVSHNIMIPGDAENANFAVGDLIGVFYQSGDQLICAGYSEWIGSNIALTAFGASFDFNGFMPNQEMLFFHFDIENQTEVQLQPIFNTTDFSNTNKFEVNGMSGISHFLTNLIEGCTDNTAINYNPTATLDNTSCISHEQLVIDSLNNVINELNSDLIECNSPLLINIQPGWNIIGYPLKDQQNLVEGFQEIVDLIQIVKNNDGDIYMPEFNFNGIGSLIPGQGYQIKLTHGYQDFTFPTF